MIKQVLAVVLIFHLVACGRPDAVNTKEEINESVEGFPLFYPDQADSSLFNDYRGVLPFENGSRAVHLTLFTDNSFRWKEQCATKMAKVCEYKGRFKYDKDRNTLSFQIEGREVSFSIEEDQLYLLDADGKRPLVKIDQSAYLSRSALELGNTVWQLVQINDTQLEERIRLQSALRFHPDGSITYRIACNQCRGSWASMSKGEVNLKGGQCTKMKCSHPYEEEFNKAIRSVRFYEIGDDQLLLTNGSDLQIRLKTPV